MRKYAGYLFSIGILSAFLAFFLYFNYMYPLQHLDYVSKFSHKYNLSEHMVLSVINSESGFNENAQSTSNALGLMQLQFATADEIAFKLGVENFSEEMLFLPKLNIEFGCYYLRFLMDYYGGNLTNALCAYNAGITNVNRWLESEKYSPDSVQLTKIPFPETANYVERIYSGVKVYKLIY